MNGVNRVVHQLASHQAKAGFDVEVWGLTDNPVHDYPPRSFKTFLFKNRKIKWLLPAAVGNELKRLDPVSTTFHLHGGFIPQHFAVSRLLLKHHIKYVITPHGHYNIIAMQKSGVKKRVYVSLFEKKLVKNAHAMHCEGKSEIDGLHSFYPEKKATLIPDGFETIHAINHRNGKRREDFVFGYCGRLDIHAKGLDNLIIGFAKFVRNHKSSLWMIGDGPGKKVLQLLAEEEKIKEHVQWLGSKYGNEKLELISSLDVFVHPSRNEALPVSILEAASLGVPCIVSRETNFEEFFHQYNAGIVLSENSPGQIALAMGELFRAKSNGRLKLMGENAVKMVAEAFNWNSIIKQMQELYA